MRCARRSPRIADACGCGAWCVVPGSPWRVSWSRKRSCGRSPGSSRSRRHRSSVPRSRSSVCSRCWSRSSGRDRRWAKPPWPSTPKVAWETGCPAHSNSPSGSRLPPRHRPTTLRSMCRTRARSTRLLRPIASFAGSAATHWSPCARCRACSSRASHDRPRSPPWLRLRSSGRSSSCRIPRTW